MGRRDEARASLVPFAEGKYAGYRQAEARELLDALSAAQGPDAAPARRFQARSALFGAMVVCLFTAVPMGKPERRQQILSVARDVFAKRGYHAAKIDDIVAAAGIARGTFYLYFEDKRAIFEEIVDRTIARLGMSIVRVDLDAKRSVADQVREQILRIVRILLEDRSTTKILLSDALGVDPAFDRKLLSFYDEMSKQLESSLRDGQALGIVGEGDVRLMAWLTMGALKETLFQIVQRGAEYDEDKLVEGAFAYFASGYLRVT